MVVESPRSSPGVRFPPPLLFVGGLAAGWALARVAPALAISRLSDTARTASGAALVVAGVALALWGAATFRAARTAIIPSRAASRVVKAGPYRFTRNPMYLGFTIAYVGAALLMATLWPLALLPLVLALLVRLVIRREEAHLEQAFPSEYALYRRQVGRWL